MLDDLAPGTYVIAVSGGVDSVALLHMLSQLDAAQWRLVVAHFDHGIRSDSAEDRALVQELATQYGLDFVFDEGRLGADASEAEARAARYTFLEKIRAAHGSQGIITAHHADDALETMILNLVRGTSRQGLTPFRNRPEIIRPLQRRTKAELQDYAVRHGLRWREDGTNQNQQYLRNYIRQVVIPQLSNKQRQTLTDQAAAMRAINAELDAWLTQYLAQQPGDHELNRAAFIQLPHALAREVLVAWLRQNDLRDFDKRMIEKLVIKSKTARPGQYFDVIQGVKLHITRQTLALEHPER